MFADLLATHREIAENGAVVIGFAIILIFTVILVIATVILSAISLTLSAVSIKGSGRGLRILSISSLVLNVVYVLFSLTVFITVLCL